MSLTSSVDVFSLPELVVDSLFSKYLDLRSLKVLRLTCRKVNGLIEINPAVLKRFRVVISGLDCTGLERVTEVLDSEIPWNNLSVSCFEIDAAEKEMFAAKFESLSHLVANHLRIIEIGGVDFFNVSCHCFLVNSASTLEVVNLRKMDFEAIASLNKAMEIVEEFSQLKFLEVRINDGLKLQNFLMKCPQLQRLIIHQYGIGENKVDEYLVQPLKDHLNYRLAQSIRLPLETKFPDNTWAASNPIPPADLIQIARLSFQVNAKLEGISIASLPTYGDVKKGGWNLKKCLDGSIRSVVSYGERFNDRYIPSTSQIFAIVLIMRGTTDFTGFELPPEVHSISIRFRVLIPEAAGLIDRILHSRPSLKELSVTEMGNYLSSYLIRLDGLPNLTKLELYGFGRKDEDFWKIYEALPLLEVLILKNCLSLRNESIIGPEVEGDNRSMLNLKYLKHLKLYWGLKITDITYKKIFSQMKLLTFEVWTKDFSKHESGISLAGLEALRQGIFGETVQFIKIDRPDGATDSELKNILQKCKYLQKFELFELDHRGYVTGIVIHLPSC